MIETFVERIRGIAAGDVNMNCSLCKYRTQVLGFERDLGAPQESHHHHVEGIGTDGGHHHHHHHGHGTRPPSRPSPPGPERQRRGLRPTARAMADYLRDPDAIYARSFALIRAEVPLDRFPPALHGLVLRLVHACGMPDIADDLAWHGDPVAAGRAALAAGAPILADARMVAAGVMTGAAPRRQSRSCSTLDDERTAGARGRARARPARPPRSSSGARISPAPWSRSATRRRRCSICWTG